MRSPGTATRVAAWSTTSTCGSWERVGTLIETLSTYFQHGGSIEATARTLFVHPNTVRYRLKQAAEVTRLTPTRPRDAFTVQIALILGRQSGRE